MLNRRSRLVLAFAAVLTASCGVGLADDTRKPTPPATDADLLEFLGSVDPTSDTAQPDDGAWIEYLSQTDIGRVAKPGDSKVAAARPPAPPPPKPTTPAPGAKQDE
jgi:hypothetical protein